MACRVETFIFDRKPGQWILTPVEFHEAKSLYCLNISWLATDKSDEPSRVLAFSNLANRELKGSG